MDIFVLTVEMNVQRKKKYVLNAFQKWKRSYYTKDDINRLIGGNVMIWLGPGENTGTQAQLKADAYSDVANLPAFATANDLKPGSSCLVIATSTVYMMNSQGQWIEL